MLTSEEARERVVRGAAHLDQVRPGWWQRIDVGTLTLHDPCGCIVGQLCGDERRRQQRFISDCKAMGVSYPLGTREHGFNLLEPGFDEFTSHGGTLEDWYQPLQDAWIEAIADRRLAASVGPEDVRAPDLVAAGSA